MPNLFSFGINILADVFYPKYCFGCRRSGGYLCKFCSAQLPMTAQSFCIMCNKPSFNGLTHKSCQTPSTPDQLMSVFSYHTQIISDMIIMGKYYFVSEVFALLGIMAAESIKNSNGFSTFSDYIICPLPLHPSKRRWRGFNQSDIIASAFEHSFNIPAIPLLNRQKRTRTQKDLNAKERKSNMTNAFVPTQEIPQKIILIDDVCTTGQTLIEATKTLKQNGAQKVICITIAKD